MMNVGGACVGWGLCGWSLCGVGFVCGACVGWGLCVDGRGLCGRSQKGVELKRGGVKKNYFNLSLSFVIPVNKMNLKSLPPLNHIPYKSKELYLSHQRF